MNRTFIVFGLLSLVATVGVSAASAQTATLVSVALASADKSNAPKVLPTGTTKVAVMNVGLIFAKYEKALSIKEEMAQELKQLREEASELAQNLKAWQAALQKNDLTATKREKYEEKIIDARRRLEDLDRQARTRVGKSQENGLIGMWKDVRAAVKAYSSEHGIQLVIAYGDPREANQLDTMPNINRKMQAMDQGAGIPFFAAPGVDISEAIVEMLNRQYREKKAEPAEQEEPR
jgi:Skp family chaperone for outer membrane proteins